MVTEVKQSSRRNNIQCTTPVTCLKGVGSRVAEKLGRLNIYTVQDVLFHLPLRYEDRTRVIPIGSLRQGDHAVIQGKIELTEIKFARKRMLLTHVRDGTGIIILRFFHFNASQQAALERGRSLRCFGEVRRSGHHLEMAHPEYKILYSDEVQQVEETLTPVYPVTEGVHQISLRNMIDHALGLLEQGDLKLQEYLPASVISRYGQATLAEAIQFIHRPPPDVSLQSLLDNRHPMQQRLVIEELITHILSLRQLRQRVKQQPAYPIPPHTEQVNRFLTRLPFELTRAQQTVVKEIDQDMATVEPMTRLVQGDVGSGKTVVAALATIKIIASGYQVALMAPTEILAEQHYQNFCQWLEPLGINVVWLTGKLRVAAKRQSLQQLADGTGQLAIGTHALFQDDVVFKKLALVIVDEQHRFGVHQRLALRNKGVNDSHVPHQLIMTATPIPRTLSMTAYADLDCSVIDELPPGRKPVETVVIPDTRRASIVERIVKACSAGTQVYWVCTLIEESEVLQCQAAEETFKQLGEAFSDLKLGLVHGRMKAEQKEATMQAFKQGELHLLVATTVVEVGVDVPNASLMIIENAERLGLSQLHQLRGRIGRGDRASVCVLMYHGKLSQYAQVRLRTIRETSDGFKIAQKDLELRGPGEVLGTRQTGLQQLKLADLQRDADLIPQASQVAGEILLQYPDSVNPLIQRWIGEASRYAKV